MMISEGSGMQADSIAISSNTPAYPVVLMTKITNAASAEITREIKRKSLSVGVQVSVQEWVHETSQRRSRNFEFRILISSASVQGNLWRIRDLNAASAN